LLKGKNSSNWTNWSKIFKISIA